MRRTPTRLAFLALFLASGATLWARQDQQPAVAPAIVQPAATAEQLSMTDWARRLWATAAAGDMNQVHWLLNERPEGGGEAMQRLAKTVEALGVAEGKRETNRATRTAEVELELDKTLAEEVTDLTLSKAMRSAVELFLLAPDGSKGAVLAQERIKNLLAKTDSAARAAESRGDWLLSSELFYRLDALVEESGKYKADVRRQNERLAMIRLYAPERLWQLRNERQVAEKEDPLPPYNPLGDDYRERLASISSDMVVTALGRSAAQNVEQVPLRDLLLGGVETVRTFVGIHDLDGVFPGLGEDEARKRMLEFVETERRALLERPAEVRMRDADTEAVINRLLDQNARTVRLPEQAVLHEFGNGAMGRLDEFSAVIWPDEIRRFNRNTQGRLIGIGVQIEFDELSNIKVVAPMDGTPAQRAGIRAGDVISKVDGKSAYGLSLDQAVDVITGPEGTQVVISVERVGDDGQKQELDFPIKRAQIQVATVKGWKRSGPREDDWNWLIDAESGIGYIRLTQFTDTTTRELDRATRQMAEQAPGGVRGVVLDLRFNPGGLLDQAVSVTARFVEKSLVVSTRGKNNTPGDRHNAAPNADRLGKLPVIVIVNEGSASASEIVSGAIRYYGDNNRIQALLLGARTFGKGSVQNVWALSGDEAAMKLTTQYYLIPGDRMIHRRPGAVKWGVDPNLPVEMLPQAITESLMLRRNADVWPQDAQGNFDRTYAETNNPQKLLADGLDLQLQTAVALLQAQSAAAQVQAAQAEPKVQQPTPN